MSDKGTVETEAATASVRFERSFDSPIEAVWRAITTPDELGKWLAPAAVDLEVGGSINVDFGEGGTAGGEILVLDPPHVLEYMWRFTGEPDSILRIELAATATGTSLLLVHRLLPAGQSVGYGAGWHAHLDQLADILNGSAARDWDERFMELLPEYQSGGASLR